MCPMVPRGTILPRGIIVARDRWGHPFKKVPRGTNLCPIGAPRGTLVFIGATIHTIVPIILRIKGVKGASQ